MTRKRRIVGVVLFSAACFALPLVPGAASTAAEPSAGEATEKAPASQDELWRFKRHNGRWWYWLPSNSWVYFQNDRWVRYEAEGNASDESQGGASGRALADFRGVEPSHARQSWPHGTNGSDTTASNRPGAAAFHTNRQDASTSTHEHFPHGQNGSDPTASSRAGGAAFHNHGKETVRRYSRLPSQRELDDEYYKWRNN